MREYRRQEEPTVGPWEQLGTRCVEVGADSEAGPSLAELVIVEWRRVVLPKAAVTVQPPDATLVNLPTVVYTTTEAQTWQVELLGQEVAIRAVPVRYVWRFGDGAELVTRDPGAPYPEHTVSHVFESRGESSASVDVTFRGEYRVGGAGEWVPIPGAVTQPGPATRIRVLEQRTELIAEE